MKTDRIFQLIAKEAKKSNHNFRVGAAIVQGSKILSIAHNQYGTHQSSNKPFKTICAEFKATRKLLNFRYDNFGSCDVYVLRLTKRRFSLARPCKYCYSLLTGLGIKRMWYTTSNGGYAMERCYDKMYY